MTLQFDGREVRIERIRSILQISCQIPAAPEPRTLTSLSAGRISERCPKDACRRKTSGILVSATICLPGLRLETVGGKFIHQTQTH
ncbi:hypothetical protein ZHAS_00009383 [Anopheles sinensis]|uniref:Uncharacterized protein n=1 Tax=Anopheles sinensis TaxID=74873 RepID=A0A084VUV6_ANOSI|nr:hypothetical protein ZHAS_00009383 [Anopheles sinensis]